MLRIKKLDIFIFKSFLLLFAGTFFICLFIFMMQFLWKYVDELVGKGLTMDVLAQFFYYCALTLVPPSLPLAVLLASLITFGNFGERYELLAMKAAGISLLKIMRPLIVFVAFICCVSFYFQDVIGPIAQSKLYTLLLSMRQKSPELDIPEGAFFEQIDGYNLYVKKKNRETGMLYDVTIYNFTKGFDKLNIVRSDSGRLEMTADKRHLYLRLYSGEQFENLESQTINSKNVPYMRETFREKHTIIEFNSEFNMLDESIMSGSSSSKNMKMLQNTIDSLTTATDSIGRKYYTDAMNGLYNSPPLTKEDTVKLADAYLGDYNVDSLYVNATLNNKQRIINSAVSRTENAVSDFGFKSYTINQNDYSIRRHKTEWHNKITLSLSCLIFFFIGAPLGAIIRKGGLGMPVVVSVLIFIFYYIVNNTGYKMARDGKWIAWMGMWMSTFILAPLGAFLTYKSNNDSVVLNADAYVNWFKRIVGIRSVRNLYKKEVIIDDPDYDRILKELPELTEECKQYLATHRLKRAPNYFKLWTSAEKDEEIIELNNKLETLVEEMSNSSIVSVFSVLNNYPIIAVNAHTRPFSRKWMNITTGLIVPLGLFFYFRIWIFRLRLNRDIMQIIATNKDVETIIKKNID